MHTDQVSLLQVRLRRLVLYGVFFLGVSALFYSCKKEKREGIDRHALVTRHNVVVNHPDTLSSLSVGNGEFAFTVDASGLQTFYKAYENGVALGTQSQWAWHTIPAEQHYSLEDVAKVYHTPSGKDVPYAIQHSERKAGEATEWLRANPHRLHLGIIGLEMTNKNGAPVQLTDLQHINQVLDLWSGKIDSKYEIDGEPVEVELYAHQCKDAIAVKVTSPLIEQGRLKVFFKFPYGKACHTCPGYDFDHPEKHQTTIVNQSSEEVLLKRTLDSTQYFVKIGFTDSKFVLSKPHYAELIPDDESSFTFTALFSQGEKAEVPGFESTEENNESAWKQFWENGGAIDFSACTDPRAPELERRVVLSQYLTKIQSSGSLPPQETGLTMNSWYGKFHLEMHWWHEVHFALWTRLNQLEKSMYWYSRIMPKAKATAAWQGYKGARWPKMTDPYGNESPSGVGAFLVWQQPHPIYYAELFYRQNPDFSLPHYKRIVFETADFMASFAQYNKVDKKYHLYPPLIPAQEIFKAVETQDPAFELAYWRYALSIAQEWRKRAGLPPKKEWQDVIDNLAPLPQKDGYYLPTAGAVDAYTNADLKRDHPIVTGAFGLIPWANKIDKDVAEKTFDSIMQDWNWETTWGWDYPMLAMAAARLGKPDKAIDALFIDTQKNTYLPNGHNYQDKRLRLYLPGNGGLLTAVAMMAAGWDGSTGSNPGFPPDGTWNVKWENLKPMP